MSLSSNAGIPLLPSSPPSSADIPIDPQLLHTDFFLAQKPDGSLVTEEVYKAHLFTIRKREPLRFTTRANLEFLWNALIRHWYPIQKTVNPSPPNKNVLSIVIPPRPLEATQSLSPSSSQTQQETPEADFDVDDEALAKEYDVEGVAEAVFGALGTGGLEDEDEDEELEDVEDFNDDDECVHVSCSKNGSQPKEGREKDPEIYCEVMECYGLESVDGSMHTRMANNIPISTFVLLVYRHEGLETGGAPVAHAYLTGVSKRFKFQLVALALSLPNTFHLLGLITFFLHGIFLINGALPSNLSIGCLAVVVVLVVAFQCATSQNTLSYDFCSHCVA
ncbi:uncharacterized protein LACBIDRAFT_330266 [Laccaria bicolor S238N-H82]|uniref:Predicted protein n=1 Tax=Laccaria bicolor (strain S238N-H82 / ATCC MYA-4686) TaxID=486041 RepID=B0DKR3_LACBS|nr:uncharacterized protein LACBIDRAFT_330266 [Laccaria bicolor S238N-H82]EDR04691.1 predicted protein [Laccaria bicolor S238N-H82]|eukprot:XP_001884515.1 predicted protein [Laccaria bicolor S238N-H82]